MNAYDVCTACSCHIKRAEPICPFCGTPHSTSSRTSGRPLFRLSRAEWLAFGSTLAVVGCTDQVTGSLSAPQVTDATMSAMDAADNAIPPETGVPDDATTPEADDFDGAAGLETGRGDSTASAEASGADDATASDARGTDDVTATAAEASGSDDAMMGEAATSYDAKTVDALVDWAVPEVSSSPAEAGVADSSTDGPMVCAIPRGTFNCDPNSLQATGRMPQEDAGVACDRATQYCALWPTPDGCLSKSDGGASVPFPAPCLACPTCECVRPYLPDLIGASCNCVEIDDAGAIGISCGGCYGSPPARLERLLRRRSAAPTLA